ncbi:MAG: penicillin-binding protein 2 [Anaerolineae bacterium]|nr:penicillin-binding protein 2 [Anaerolineae bacterium]
MNGHRSGSKKLHHGATGRWLAATRALQAVFLALLTILMSGCGVAMFQPTPTVEPSPTPNLPPADEVGFAFLQAWERGDYPAMYSLLSPAAQQQYTEEEFTSTYQGVVYEATILRVTPAIQASYQPGPRAEVTFGVDFRTAMVGDFHVENQMALSYEQDAWGVEWSPALILPQLGDNTFVRLTTQLPSRGNIYDRNGLGLAVQGESVAVGVIPGQIQNEAAVLGLLSELLGQSHAALRTRYASALADWYVPLGQISAETAQAYYQVLSSTPGIELRESWTRSYREETTAPHMVGIVGPIPSEEVEAWRAQGYTGDEMVGWMGLERWGEPYLAGQRGGRLEILTKGGQQVAVLATRSPRESSSLYTTFDREFQQQVQDILGQRLGAIAVVEAKTGRILALATYPSFDPNPFASGISTSQWQVLQADSRRPLVNRATQGTYPAGSVFKIVTMTAGMEDGGLTANSSFLCRGTWTGLGPQWPKTCWATYGHGNIPLARALTVSCDITFYQVGLMLNGVGQEVLPGYARSFGFGAPTGIEIEEDPGLVPDPAWKIQNKGEGWAPGDAVNLAIGQSELLVTPLQVAMMLAAVGNGGTLYRPQVVEMIASDPSNPDWLFEPVAVAQLPISKKNLTVIQDSLYRVTSASEGTAYTPFKGLDLAVAGKTGTAESGKPDPHAWFAGYAPADEPEIAMAVIVENSGEGAAFAAPLFRQVLEAYFGIEPTPTPSPTTTATASP